MEITTKFQCGQSVWIMDNNKAVEREVAKIRIYIAPLVKGGNVRVDVRYDLAPTNAISYSTEKDLVYRAEDLCFDTKRSLIDSL